MTNLYFAYGSNLHVDQMRRRCPDSRLVGPAHLPRHELTFFGRSAAWEWGGVANVEERERGRVPGAVYEVTERDLARLDQHENMYERLQVSVHGRGTNHTAWVYRASRGRAPSIPSSRYLATMAHGYGHHGHSLASLFEALSLLDRLFDDI